MRMGAFGRTIRIVSGQTFLLRERRQSANRNAGEALTAGLERGQIALLTKRAGATGRERSREHVGQTARDASQLATARHSR